MSEVARLYRYFKPSRYELHLALDKAKLTFNGQVTVVVQNNTILKKLIDNIKKVDGIDKIIRVYK
jgi:hypothetical protein